MLRHLYEGDLIDYPVPDDHADRPLFDGLERKGWIARWRRIWPLRHRYRLTERGIAEIERQYDPATGERVFAELRAQGIPPKQRGAWLRDRGYDPGRWSAIHDPHTHWETFRHDPGPNWLYVREVRDAAEERREREREEHAMRERLEDLDTFDAPSGAHGGEALLGDIS